MQQDSKPSYEAPDSISSSYGRYFFSVVVGGGAQINFSADKVAVVDGALVAYSVTKERTIATLSFATGQWFAFWAASMLDGRPVCVDKAWGWTP